MQTRQDKQTQQDEQDKQDKQDPLEHIIRTKVFERWPQDDDELHAFVRAVWGYCIPRTQVCTDHVAPFTAFANAYFARDPVAVWEASRGFGGKTNMLAVLALTEALTLKAGVTILGGSGAQSQMAHRATDLAWTYRNAPQDQLTKNNQFDTQFKSGGWIRSLMASQTAVRGPHPQRLRMDEIDEMEMKILEAAQGQPMRMPSLPNVETQTVMSSTHQHPDGTMTEILKRSVEMGWGLYKWSISGDSMVTTDRGLIEIQHVRTTDRVATSSGWRNIQHVTMMGVKQVLAIELSNGRTLRVTPDHEVLTPSGWEMAGFLEPGSLVVGTKTLPAVTPSIGTDVSVFRRVLVPAGAVSTCDLCLDMGSESHVFPVSDIPQMSWSDASRSSAPVVELSDDGVASEDAPRQSVSELLFPLVAATDRAVPCFVSGIFPDPASSSGDFDAIKDVTTIVDDFISLGDLSVGADFAPGASGISCDCPAVDAVVHVVSIHNGAIVPVYDIGVEDDHEFVAEGVVVHNCYRESSNQIDGWLSQSEIKRKQKEVTAIMWETEYELQEPNFEGRAIDTQKVEECFDPSLGEFLGSDNELIQIEDPPDHPNRLSPYSTGVDWAKERDWTVVVTFRTDCAPWKCVAWRRFQRLPWPVMVQRAQQQWRRYGGLLVHDGTSLGDVVDDLLDVEPVERRQGVVNSLVMTGQKRSGLFVEYISGIENNAMIYPRIHWAYDQHRYVVGDDLWTASGHPPDSFVAGACAWSTHPKNKKKFGLELPISFKQKSYWNGGGLEGGSTFPGFTPEHQSLPL